MMNIRDLSLDQLKSLAYDQTMELQRVQTNLSILSGEIANRMAEAPVMKEAKAPREKKKKQS